MSSDLFPPATIDDVTRERKIAELNRELDMRAKVYPNLVRQGKVKQETADRRILVLQSILADYQGDRKCS